MKRVTRKTLAEQAGLSVSTVGMILSGNGDRYNKATRNKVLQLARKHNYQPSIIGRSLKSNRSFLLGVLVYGNNSYLVSNFLRGLQDKIYDQDFSPVVFFHNNPQEEKDCLRKCLDRQVDGLIVNPVLNASGEIELDNYQTLIDAGLPMTEVFGHFMPDTPKVNVDMIAAGRRVTEHLIALGHHRISMLTHDRYDYVCTLQKGKKHLDAWQYYQGYEQQMRASGLEPLVVTHRLAHETDAKENLTQGGHHSLRSIWNHAHKPTAVICYSDYHAYGLLKACRERGICVPKALSIVGFGDLELSKIVTPSLTTLKFPSWEMGQASAGLLLDLLAGRKKEDISLFATLESRESTASPCEGGG